MSCFRCVFYLQNICALSIRIKSNQIHKIDGLKGHFSLFGYAILNAELCKNKSQSFTKKKKKIWILQRLCDIQASVITTEIALTSDVRLQIFKQCPLVVVVSINCKYGFRRINKHASMKNIHSESNKCQYSNSGPLLHISTQPNHHSRLHNTPFIRINCFYLNRSKWNKKPPNLLI